MISTSERGYRRPLLLGMALALCFLVACDSDTGLGAQATGATAVAGTPAASEAQPTHPSQVSTPTPTLQPTATLIPTAMPPTETLQPSPTVTSSPTVTATPLPPTPEIEVAEGEVVFESTLGEEVIRAAVPAEVVPILEAAGMEPGKYEEVEKAVWNVEENAILLGKIPVFVRSGSEWTYNEQVVYEENYINLGPALVLPNVSSFSNPELTEWPPAGVFISNHSGFDTVAISGQLAGGQISEVVLLYRGNALNTQRANLQFKFQNPNTGGITSFWMTQHDSIWIDNKERSFSSGIPSTGNAVVASILTSRKSYQEFKVKLIGSELGDIDIETLRSIILQGGTLPSDSAFIEIGLGQY